MNRRYFAKLTAAASALLLVPLSAASATPVADRLEEACMEGQHIINSTFVLERPVVLSGHGWTIENCDIATPATINVAGSLNASILNSRITMLFA